VTTTIPTPSRSDGPVAACRPTVCPADQKLQDRRPTRIGVTDSSPSTGVTDESSFYATRGAFEGLPGRVADGYAWPAYDSHSLDRVPGTAAAALGVEFDRSLPAAAVPDGEYENVVVLLIDGYGWDRFQAGERPALLDRLAAAGETTPITSVYPTETAAAITSLNTGRTPAEHGLLGWNLRLPPVDRTVQTLPFLTRPADDARIAAANADGDTTAGADGDTTAGADGDTTADADGDTIAGADGDTTAGADGDTATADSDSVAVSVAPTAPSVPTETPPTDLTTATDGAVDGTDLFDGRSVYERLADAGVESHAIQPSRIVGGPYGEVATAGAQRHGVDSVAAFALSIRRQLGARTTTQSWRPSVRPSNGNSTDWTTRRPQRPSFSRRRTTATASRRRRRQSTSRRCPRCGRIWRDTTTVARCCRPAARGTSTSTSSRGQSTPCGGRSRRHRSRRGFWTARRQSTTGCSARVRCRRNSGSVPGT
jgi:hypothetical protein